MNPFTDFISKKLKNKKLQQFIADWDVVECTVIDTYRQQGDAAQQENVWRRVRKRLLKTYSDLEKELAPHWQLALIDGEPAQEDPFWFLLKYESVHAFHQNWRAMQTLPAAREAINRLVYASTIG